MMQLEKPQVQYEKSFREAFAEMDNDSDRNAWVYLGEEAYADFFQISFSAYVQRLIDCEKKPPKHFVRGSTYWAIENGEVVGRVGIRHELNPFLRRLGGHIGYIVRPSRRGKGVATNMLNEVLITELARAIGSLLITCDADNVASEKTILRNGGKLESVVAYDPNRPAKKRFWVHLNRNVEVHAADGGADLDSISDFYKIFNYTATLDAKDQFILATVGERLVGAVRLVAENDFSVLRGMFIHPDFQRQGLGSKILSEFSRLLRDKKIATAYLICGPHLRGFYGSIGFKEVSDEKAPEFLRKRRSSYITVHGNQIILRYTTPSGSY